MAKKSVWDADFDPEEDLLPEQQSISQQQVADMSDEQEDDVPSPQARRSCCLSLSAMFILAGCLLGYAFFRLVCWMMDVHSII